MGFIVAGEQKRGRVLIQQPCVGYPHEDLRDAPGSPGISLGCKNKSIFCDRWVPIYN